MTYEYLEKLFRTKRGLAGSTEIGKRLNRSPQTVSNWRERGVPESVAAEVRAMKLTKK